MRPVAIAAVISLMSPTIAIAKDCYPTATAIKNQPSVLLIVLLPEKNGIKFYHCLLLWKIGGLDFLHRYNCQSDPYHMTGKLEIMDKNLVQLILGRSALDRLA